MYNDIATRIVTPGMAEFVIRHVFIPFGKNAFHGSGLPGCPCRNVTVNHERRFSMKIEMTCATCGKVFLAFPSQVKLGRKYCSLACCPRGGSDNGNWRGGLVSCTCIVCGKEFSVKQKIIKAGRGNFCSRSCASKHHGQFIPNTRVTKTCIVCGNSTEVKSSHVDFAGTYCSRSCMATDYQQRLAGEKNPNYRHGNSKSSVETVKLRKQRLKNNGGHHSGKDIEYLFRHQLGECAHCLCKLNTYHIDHVIPVSRGGTDFVGNLQLLCPECNRHKLNRLTIEWKYDEIIKGRRKKLYAEKKVAKRKARKLDKR
jgi:5-methylcytosine-specific restriction endonuclease McrA